MAGDEQLDRWARAALERLDGGARPPRIGVVGDVILDRFVYGDVDRISPEAPVPVVEVHREVVRLGGAANVAHNLKALGAEVDLLGVVGADSMAAELTAELEARRISPELLVTSPDRPTAVKTRVIARHQQVVRFDRERRGPLPGAVREAFWQRVDQRAGGWDGVIVSDYGKGVVDRGLVERLVGWAAQTGAWVSVDPKPVNVEAYRGANAVTPNTKETEAMAGMPAREDAEAEAAGRALLDRLGLSAVVLTRGERGMTVVEPDRMTHLPTRARDVFDVTGAGDTAIAVFALAKAAGAGVVESAALANVAAGIVVGKLGTATVTRGELEDALGPPP
ncbi:MAG: D-glycero-beta-D-manno-heptose-7-phosphate kinase [Deltaproteobacteria bacterium]|nr:D-glycero-beta-D-manno-heptose-7-phosphate kinase [Deltaproteobacteria bacterium]